MGKGMKKTAPARAMKKPACTKKTEVKAKKRKVTPMTMTKFVLSQFIDYMLKVLSPAAESWVQPETALRWSSAFDGLNTPGYVLQALLGKGSSHAWGAEIAPAAAAWSLRRGRPGHLYEDRCAAKDVAHTCDAAGGWCNKHGQRCALEPGGELFIAGWVCKDSSVQNAAKRYKQDPTNSETSVSEATFQQAVSSILHNKPKFFILENVLGVRKPVKKKAEDEQEPVRRATPLDHYMAVLTGLHDGAYQVAAVDVSSRPLPEKRERVYILGTLRSSGAYQADKWAEEVMLLEKQASTMPVHHLRTMGIGKGSGNPKPDAKGEKKVEEFNQWQFESEYHERFASVLTSAMDAGKIPKDTDVPRVVDRPSQKLQGLVGATAWQLANADVLHMMLEAQLKSDYIPDPLPLADISQSAAWGKICCTGEWFTLTTATRILDFTTGKILSPSLHFQMLGYMPEDVKDEMLKFWSDKELYDMTGNTMSVAALVKVLLPFVHQRQL
ncbi:unnamed protein product, partial [Symbiodinium sp. CCMP2456]